MTALSTWIPALASGALDIEEGAAAQEAEPGDDMLAGRARQDPSAFAELYRRHVERVFRYHVAHTGCREDSQDLTAETFLAALQGIGSYRARGSFAAWLLGIARHKVAMHFRSRKRLSPLEQALETVDPAPSTEAVAVQRLQHAEFAHALGMLSPDRAEAIRLCIYGELKAGEAGLVMGKSAAAVKMLVYRGLKDLRERSLIQVEMTEQKEGG